MAVPKYRHSKARTRRRRSINGRVTFGHLIECGNCGASKRPHYVCPKCGFYRGKEIVRSEDLS